MPDRVQHERTANVGSTPSEPLRSVLIVGGGTAGWLAAAVLRSYLDAGQLDIGLIESPDVPTIGVGEATVPPLVELVRSLGIDEADMMAFCNASWKLGIRFDGWHPGEHRYWHPFGPGPATVDGLPLFYFWLRQRLATNRGAFADCSPTVALAEGFRGLLMQGGSSPVVRTGAYAYHLDANRLGEYFRTLCVQRGVHHIPDRVASVQVDAGRITGITCEGTGVHHADLYIDASGFHSLLSGGAQQIDWIDWGDRLLCNRAIAVPVETARPLPPYTTATALPAGWAWRVPLTHRTGCGYVFSSNHVDDAQALDQLGRLVAPETWRGPPRFLDMPVGRRRTFWNGNCVAVGLASGFIEPLESTGIFLVQAAMRMLLKYFPDRSLNPALIERYNQRMIDTYEDIRDFIVLHYILSGREEPFWQDARQVDPGPALQELIAFYDATGMVERNFAGLFSGVSVQYLMAGNGRLPAHPPAQACRLSLDRLSGILSEIEQRNQALVQDHEPHDSALARFTAGRATEATR